MYDYSCIQPIAFCWLQHVTGLPIQKRSVKAHISNNLIHYWIRLYKDVSIEHIIKE